MSNKIRINSTTANNQIALSRNNSTKINKIFGSFGNCWLMIKQIRVNLFIYIPWVWEFSILEMSSRTKRVRHKDIKWFTTSKLAFISTWLFTYFFHKYLRPYKQISPTNYPTNTYLDKLSPNSIGTSGHFFSQSR